MSTRRSSSSPTSSAISSTVTEKSRTRWNNIKIGIEHSPNAQLCLNADDSLTASLAEEVPNPVLYYGVNTPIYRDRVQELSDAPYCICIASTPIPMIM